MPAGSLFPQWLECRFLGSTVSTRTKGIANLFGIFFSCWTSYPNSSIYPQPQRRPGLLGLGFVFGMLREGLKFYLHSSVLFFSEGISVK